MIYFAGLNFAIGAFTWVAQSSVQIDNMAHLGGFLGGLLFGLPLVPRLGAPRRLFAYRRRLAVLLVASVLLLFGVYLTRLYPTT